MKPGMTYRYTDGKWWCWRMGVMGCGSTPREAWDDMWVLYREAIRPKQVYFTNTRQG